VRLCTRHSPRPLLGGENETMQSPAVFAVREGGGVSKPREARSSPLPLCERSETKRSEVSGRGVKLCREPEPLSPALSHKGERERTAAVETGIAPE
jgi:hypothetical protein